MLKLEVDLTFDFFSSLPLLKGRQPPLSISESVNVDFLFKLRKTLSVNYVKRDRLLVSKVEFNFQISQRNKKRIYWSSCELISLNWVNKKSQSSIVLENQTALKPYIVEGSFL